jgi:hypothetical protein
MQAALHDACMQVNIYQYQQLLSSDSDDPTRHSSRIKWFILQVSKLHLDPQLQAGHQHLSTGMLVCAQGTSNACAGCAGDFALLALMGARCTAAPPAW